jgi:Adenylate and Guanylate cyclase catalytic domain
MVYATLGTIGFEGRFDYAAIGTVSNVASRLCDEAKPGQILISPRVFTAVKDAVTVEPVGEFTLKGIARPLAAYNVLAAASPNARQTHLRTPPHKGLVHDGAFVGYLHRVAVVSVARVRRSAADCGMARKARHVRVRAALCR